MPPLLPHPSARRRGLAALDALLLLLLLALGSWPFLETLGYHPMAPDSGLWISRGATDREDWTQWVFHTRHFGVGYRPLTALSYTWNHWWGGLNPLVYRCTDLALHLGSAVLLFALVRCASDKRAAAWAALIVFLVAPAHEAVVPYIARRGYSLASAWVLLGLWIAWAGHGLAKDSRRLLRSLAVALCFGLGVWSHEAALLGLLGLPLPFALGTEERASFVRRLRAYLAGALLPTLAVAGALATRLRVVEGVGGYDGVDEERWSRAAEVAQAAWRAVVTGRGLGPQDGSSLWLVLSGVCALWLVATALLPRGRGLLQPIIALLALGGIYASQGVWFDRQAYLLTVPTAIASGLAIGLGLSERRWLSAGPALLWIALLAFHSPVLRGPGVERSEEWRGRQALFDALIPKLEEVVDEQQLTTVHLVLPYDDGEIDMRLKARTERKAVSRQDRQPLRWIETLFHDRRLALEELLYFAPAGPPEASLEYVQERGNAFVHIPAGWTYQKKARRKFKQQQAGSKERVKLPPVMKEDRAFLFLADSGEWIPLEPR